LSDTVPLGSTAFRPSIFGHGPQPLEHPRPSSPAEATSRRPPAASLADGETAGRPPATSSRISTPGRGSLASPSSRWWLRGDARRALGRAFLAHPHPSSWTGAALTGPAGSARSRHAHHTRPGRGVVPPSAAPPVLGGDFPSPTSWRPDTTPTLPQERACTDLRTTTATSVPPGAPRPQHIRSPRSRCTGGSTWPNSWCPSGTAARPAPRGHVQCP